jgi:hypothetical protein
MIGARSFPSLSRRACAAARIRIPSYALVVSLPPGACCEYSMASEVCMHVCIIDVNLLLTRGVVISM